MKFGRIVKGFDSVLFLFMTPNSELKKKYEKAIKKSGLQIKIVNIPSSSSSRQGEYVAKTGTKRTHSSNDEAQRKIAKRMNGLKGVLLSSVHYQSIQSYQAQILFGNILILINAPR